MKRDNNHAATLAILETVSKFLRFGKNWRNLENANFSPRIRQCYVTLGIVLITISLGMVEGYSAILLPQLKSEGNMEVDDETASWIASISALPSPVGCILGGWLMETLGRKTIHMLTCIPCLAGWILIYFSTSTTTIMIGRLTSGICVGILGPPSGVYAAETSDPTFRGFLLAAISLAITLALFAYMSFITIGIIPLPWTMMGELFPLAYRGVGSGISSFMNSMFMFSVVKTTPWMFGNLGTDGTFLLFGIVCLVGTVVLALFLPETKNKPLHVIEDSMKGVGTM